MRFQTSLSRYRLVLGVMGGLTLFTALCRTLALFLDFDRGIGYFQKGALLPVVTYVLTGMALAAAVALPFLFKKEELPSGAAVGKTVSTAAAGVAAVAFLAVAVYMVWRMIAHATADAKLPAPAVLMLLSALALLAGAGYFLLLFFGRAKAAAPFGFGVIFAAVLLLSVTYFDRYTPMNAPSKVMLHLSLLAVMVYMLYALRTHIGRAMPRVHLGVSAAAFFLCGTTGLSNLIASAHRENGGVYAACDLLLLAVALYIAVTAAEECTALTPQTEEEGAEA